MKYQTFFDLTEGLHCTCIFRTCVFHPCRFVLAFCSTCVFSAHVHTAWSHTQMPPSASTAFRAAEPAPFPHPPALGDGPTPSRYPVHSAAERPLQNIQNYCHQWLSPNFIECTKLVFGRVRLGELTALPETPRRGTLLLRERRGKGRPFNGLFSRTTWVSRHHKGKTSLDLHEARDDGILGCSDQALEEQRVG